jgi:uncharacterized membrane protein SpoIIM required for sporulation
MPAPSASDINQFLMRRQAQWRRLELLLEQVERDGLASLARSEVREFGILYRRASSDLVTARSKTANAMVLEYLNDLVARAYAQVYRSRRFHPRDILTFFRLDFPRLTRQAWKPMLLSSLICVASGVAGWLLGQRDPAGAYHFLPAEMVRQMPVLREHWKGTSGHSIGPTEMSIMSSFIMTHNIGIGIAAFAGGIAFGLPSLYVLVQSGMMLGILGEGMTRPTTALTFWSLILPHGVIELSAICVMGGAGFVIAGALIAPGRRSIRDSLIEQGRTAVMVALGGGGMLVVAGLIEGFITPPAFIPPWAKLTFAALTALGEVLYFGLAGRSAEAGTLTGPAAAP